MNTVADPPVPGLAPELSEQPAADSVAAALAPDLHKWTWHRVKDTLVTIYAFGILGFGLLFPFALAAWFTFIGPAGQ